MKVYFLFFLILFGNISFGKSIDDCKILFDNSQYDKASSCYYSLLSDNSQNVQAVRLGYGNSLYAQKKYNLARVQYNNVIQINPNNGYGRAAKHNIELANQMLKTINTSKKLDDGNYLSEVQYAMWSSMPVKVWFENGIYTSNAKRAFVEWQNKTQGTVRFIFVPKEKDAQIVVRFSPDITSSSGSGDALGVTKLAIIQNNVIYAAEMDIKTTTRTGEKQTPSQIYPVVLHEVGHALGIRGHSHSKFDAMYPSNDTYRNSLSNRDINTVKSMYKK